MNAKLTQLVNPHTYIHTLHCRTLPALAYLTTLLYITLRLQCITWHVSTLPCLALHTVAQQIITHGVTLSCPNITEHDLI